MSVKPEAPLSSIHKKLTLLCVGVFPAQVSVPLLVCGSKDDVVIDPNLWQGWQPWLKEGDRPKNCGNAAIVLMF